MNEGTNLQMAEQKKSLIRDTEVETTKETSDFVRKLQRMLLQQEIDDETNEALDSVTDFNGLNNE